MTIGEYEHANYTLPESGFKVEFRRRLGFYEFRLAKVEVAENLLGSMINSIHEMLGEADIWAPVHPSMIKEAQEAFDL